MIGVKININTGTEEDWAYSRETKESQCQLNYKTGMKIRNTAKVEGN